MQSHGRSIEIFAPFSDALELTRKILFQPFDIGKWFVIGFAAWLATFFTGMHFNYSDRHHWSYYSRTFGPNAFHDTSLWLYPLIICGLIFGLAFGILFLWLNARGRFMFTDCIVRNRGAIVEPWREYRVEANSYFVFQACVVVGSMLLFGALAAVLFVIWSVGVPVIPVVLLIFLGVIWVILMILFSLISRLMVAVMYRQRCSALTAFRKVWALCSITCPCSRFARFSSSWSRSPEP